MPYVSDKQRGYMHVHLPEIAARWDKEMREKKKKTYRKKTSGRA